MNYLVLNKKVLLARLLIYYKSFLKECQISPIFQAYFLMKEAVSAADQYVIAAYSPGYL